MKSLLPMVDSEVGFSLAKTVGEKGDAEFIKTELKRLDKENPTVADFIRKWSLLGDCQTHTKFCGILVYKLLRSQAEADRMTEDLNIL